MTPKEKEQIVNAFYNTPKKSYSSTFGEFNINPLGKNK